ncbi:alpha/beta-hydrolase [Auriscalpium vulgare]|uniref:Alpha/beta-hydrolase n=1 Tax=Auriscalpium vulgare TaxID=40419 RepID=A0ACB8RD74_9AGAM|nr:alpha/beta-hydrolase [Auriscalpium vulgare]
MPFAFRRQPFKALYLTGAIATLLLVRLPFQVIRNIVPAWRPRRTWSLGRSVLVSVYSSFIEILYNTSLLSAPALDDAAKTPDPVGFVWVQPTPDLIVGDVREAASVNKVESVRIAGFWSGVKDADGKAGQKATATEKVIYHFHGGGFVMGTAHPSSGPVKTLFDGFFKHSQVPRIFALEYRLSVAPPFGSENAFPAALIDAIAGYRYLVKDVGFKPENIIVSGDSAGGDIAYALARYVVVNTLPGLPAPGAALLLSPTVDWAVTHDGPQSSMVRNTRSDFVHAIFTSGYTVRALVGRLPPDAVATNAWISPASRRLAAPEGLFAGFPRTCIVAGGAEMTLDPMRTLRDRMVKDMGDEAVVYIEVADSAHDFLTAAWHEPERTNTFKEVGEWLDSL